MEINCPFSKNIECSVNGALDFYCSSCGFFPAEQRRRKKALYKQSAELETKRRKNIMQLTIQHKGKKVSYSLQAVRKRTDSPKTNIQLKNQQGDG